MRSAAICNFCWPNWSNFYIICKNETKFGPLISIENLRHTCSQTEFTKTNKCLLSALSSSRQVLESNLEEQGTFSTQSKPSVTIADISSTKVEHRPLSISMVANIFKMASQVAQCFTFLFFIFICFYCQKTTTVNLNDTKF